MIQKITLTLAAATVALALSTGCATAQDSAAKWTNLFDGASTDAFRGYKTENFPKDGWAVTDGALKTVTREQGGKPADIMTREKYENYELELEWKVSPGGNSGVIYNVEETSGPAWHTGPEMQVLDDTRHPDGKNPKTSSGSLYAMIAPNEKKTVKPVGEWNKARLAVNKGKVEHWLNGEKIVEYQWDSPQIKELIAQSKFKNLPKFMQVKEGHVVIQHHGEEVWYRNIRIRKL